MAQTSLGVEREDHDAFKKYATDNGKKIKELFHEVVEKLTGGNKKK